MSRLSASFISLQQATLRSRSGSETDLLGLGTKSKINDEKPKLRRRSLVDLMIGTDNVDVNVNVNVNVEKKTDTSGGPGLFKQITNRIKSLKKSNSGCENSSIKTVTIAYDHGVTEVIVYNEQCVLRITYYERHEYHRIQFFENTFIKATETGINWYGGRDYNINTSQYIITAPKELFQKVAAATTDLVKEPRLRSLTIDL